MAQKALPAAKKVDAAKFLPGAKSKEYKKLASNKAKVISRDESLVLVHKKLIKVEKLIQTNFKIKSISDKKRRLQYEKEKDRIQEEIIEDTPKDSNLKKTESKLPVPGFAFFGEIKDAILKLFFGWLAIKMLPHLPKLLGFLPVLKQGLETVTDWMIGGLDALTGFLAEGYKVYDSAKDWITDTFGESGKKNFEAVTGHITKAFNLISIIAMGMIASAGFGGKGPKGKGPKRGIKNKFKRFRKGFKRFLGQTDKNVIDRAKNIKKIKRAKFFNKFVDPAKKLGSKAKNLGGKGIDLAKRLVPKSLPSVGGMLSGLWNWGGQQTQKIGEAVGKTWDSSNKFVANLSAKTRALWDDVAKKITPYLDEIGKGVKSMGDSLGSRWNDLQNLSPQKTMEKMQSRMMKNVEILMKKNPVLKKVMTALNPRNAAAKMGGLLQNAQNSPALKKILSVLKSNRAASAAKGLGPIDKVITALTALADYTLFKESPINAIFKGLGGLVGYGLGFASASAVPVLGQSGIFNFAGGIAGASLGEYISFLMLKGLAKTPLANIEDPIAANTQGMTPRKLIRNPENLSDHLIDDKLIKQAQEEGIGDPVSGFGIDDKKITETPSNNQTSSTTTSTSASTSSTQGGSGGGIRNAGRGSKMAGELGRFLDKEGLGNWGSGVHQHPEHPDWPRESGHRVGSLHYASKGGRAIDVGGWGPNTYRREGESGTDDQTRIMQGIARFHKKKGLPPPPGGTAEWAHEGNEPTGHWNHVHVAYGGGGLVKGLTNAMLGERGPEFVIDADSTAALRTTFPGLLEALNKADYDGTINVLRSYAEYEKGLSRESDTKRQNIILNQQTTSDPVVKEKVVFLNKSDPYASCYLNR